jgi:hypothetical protein
MTWKQIWNFAQQIPGAYSEYQAYALYNACLNRKLLVEIGSYYGRSTSIMLSTGQTTISIDPGYDAETHDTFMSNMRLHPNFNNLLVLPCLEENAFETWNQKIELLHIDTDSVYFGETEQVKNLLLRWMKFAECVLIHHCEQQGTASACKQANLSIQEIAPNMAMGFSKKVYL